MIWFPAAWACDVPTEVRAAQEQLLGMDLDATASALEQAAASLACDPVEPSEVAVLFLVDGARARFAGDEERARALFGAASRAAPEVWLVDLGDELQQLYREARVAAAPAGQLRVDAPPGDGVRIDGRAATSVAVGGPHVVQVLRGGELVFGERLDVVGDRVVTVPGPVVAPAPEPAPPSRSRGVDLGLRPHAGVGASVALGEGATAGALTEPGANVTAPAELGLVLRTGPLWWRAAGGVGASLTGPLLYASPDGARDTRLVVLGAVGGGATLGRWSPGAQVGLWLPGRRSVEGVLGVGLAGPLSAEVRGGVRSVQNRGVEGAASLWVTLGGAG